MEIRGKGSVIALEDKPRRKCRYWKLQVSLGRSPNKKDHYPRKTKNFRGTYTQALEALEEFKEELKNKPTASDMKNPTVEQYCDYWREKRITSGKYAKRTLRSDKDRLNQYIFHIGNLYMRTITSERIEQVHADMKKGKTPSGRPSSGTTINSAFKTFKLVLKSAAKKGLIKRDIIEDIEPVATDTQEAKYLSSEEIEVFLDKLDPLNPMHLAVLLCMMLGLRRSEVLALRWRDYDDGMLYINCSLEEDGSEKETKNEASEDSVPVIPSLAAILDLVKAEQEKLLEESGAEISIDDLYIIRKGLSGNYKPRELNKWWEKHREEFGCEGLRIHDLRHSFASELKRLKVDIKDRQVLLRHASSRTTNDTYTHVDVEEKRAAVVPVEGRFAPNLLQKCNLKKRNAS